MEKRHCLGTVRPFFFCNKDWEHKINKFQIDHLPLVQSDYNPLFLSYNSGYRTSKQYKPFQSLAA